MPQVEDHAVPGTAGGSYRFHQPMINIDFPALMVLADEFSDEHNGRKVTQKNLFVNDVTSFFSTTMITPEH
jgi:hypothetical protein